MSARQVPYLSIICSGALAGTLAFFLNLDSLWDFVSIVRGRKQTDSRPGREG